MNQILQLIEVPSPLDSHVHFMIEVYILFIIYFFLNSQKLDQRRATSKVLLNTDQ